MQDNSRMKKKEMDTNGAFTNNVKESLGYLHKRPSNLFLTPLSLCWHRSHSKSEDFINKGVKESILWQMKFSQQKGTVDITHCILAMKLNK